MTPQVSSSSLIRVPSPVAGWSCPAQGPGAGSARVLIDGRTRVLMADSAAETLMGDDVVVARNRLRASSAAADVRLQALLAAAVRPLWPRAGAVALPTRTGRPLVARATPLVDAAADEGPRAVVRLTALDRPPSPDPRLLQEAFQFTPCETRLAAMLAEGCGLGSAAAELAVSVSTARTHLKAIFAKTDTHSQAELATLLARMLD